MATPKCTLSYRQQQQTLVDMWQAGRCLIGSYKYFLSHGWVGCGWGVATTMFIPSV